MTLRFQTFYARRSASGFTLLELLASVSVLALILAVMLSIINNTSALTRRAEDKITAFQAARAAFDQMAASLSQATLNTYWDYDNAAMPTRYLRTSELHFLVGQAGTAPLPGSAGTGQALFFQAPLGLSASPASRTMSGLLNACGFYVEYDDADPLPTPPFPAAEPRYRYRLMQALDVSENLAVYKTAATDQWHSGEHWISGMSSNAVPIAENVIYLAIWPRKSPTDDPEGSALTGPASFSYNSRRDPASTTPPFPQPVTENQLPPVVQITMVVIDESSAARVCTEATEPAAITAATDNLFTVPDSDTFAEDLKQLEANLTAARLNYRVFSALIAIRESKME